ncbi:BamA/TamA family outer membrane protein [Cesiribacter andamanensis]|uniref:Outer membrane protein/protective antigen OMA87 n=1 Tax=Cesiribacter andamanensis AMV16 TaxID=1279009 RepID=M7N5R0_9BACT|nr:outer membrane protein/protective antigen OMA87 [Cesiribacter andamanensis]EMR03968.1 Outer membrane protein/protective antigen OMA87 [Cesiribacter andamanensis AMV16]
MMHTKPAAVSWSWALPLAFFIAACGAVKPYIAREQRSWQEVALPPAEELLHTVYLVGDAGKPDKDRQEPSLRLLESQLRGQYRSEQDGGISQLPDSLKSVIFLGDNIYEDGLSAPDDPDREEEERIIVEQMQVVQSWAGTPVFIPGNHDWNHSRVGGLEKVMRQGEFVRQFLDNPRAFLPFNGCPGPVALPVGDNVVLVLIDSEWWLTPHRRPRGPEGGCNVESELDFIVQLDDMLSRYSDKHIVLALHHPLKSNGNHGGHYNLGDHIFPLRLKYANAYVPLPLIGSIYPLGRMYGVSRQDIANPKYQQLINALTSITEGRTNVVIAAGHEHNLQLQELNGVMHIVSGSGAKETFCVGGRDALFVHRSKGFARLNYYKNGEVWVEFWVPEGDGEQGTLTFRTPLYALTPAESKEVKEAVADLNYSDSTKVVAANPEYAQRSRLSRAIWGDHYRQEWSTPIEVRYLDLQRAKGGLTPIRKGGGKQTLSLRLLNPDSIQYQFRSIDKIPSAILPPGLQTTFAADVVQDQISSAHPYGSFTVPRMADAIGIYHTDPELYYMPSSALLGPYISDFGGMIGLLEIRPDEDLTAYRNFGFTQNAISTRNMLSKLQEDNDDDIDQPLYLRTRLFDMLIGDWDRHEDQWRWAEFEKEGKGKRYLPIPRDRDQVFVKFDGIVPWLGSRKWAVRHFSHFDYEFEDVKGLNLSALKMDRRLLSGLSYAQWQEQVAHIQENLEDVFIEEAMRQMPDEVFSISGPEIIAKLKSRRAVLDEAAREYYLALAKYVDVFGSDKHERFEVERLPDGSTRVVVYKIKKDGEQEHILYDRLFLPDETREIRLWGLAGEDEFRISGEAPDAILLRVIGGAEKDSYKDVSRVRGGRSIIYYDNVLDENKIEKGQETNLRLSNKDYINDYDADDFFYTYLGPRLSLAFNPDDGVFIGGGANLRSYGFRKSPAASDQTLLVNYAFATGAYNFRYKGAFYQAFGRGNDLLLDLSYQGPQFVLNYFGQGNESPKTEPIDFYRVRLNSFNAELLANRRLGPFINIGIGPHFRWVGVNENKDTYIDSDDFRTSDLYASEESMLGGRAYFRLDATNDPRIPTRGVIIENSLQYTNSLRSENINLTRLHSEFSIYISPNTDRFRPTIALRFGGQRNWGDYLFYQSAAIGNNTTLRGFRNYRFAGYGAAYQNTELRVPISPIYNYVFTGSWGLYGFIDHARVWAEGEDSIRWHRGFGPGAYLNLYQLFVVSGGVSFSREGPYFLLRSGFFF